MRVSHLLAVPILFASLALPAGAATLEATYLFNNTLAAQEAGAPALTATDPLGVATFQTATVDSQTRTVYRWGGNASPPSDQGGLTFDNSGALLPNDSYSVQMIFEFDNVGGWRRILDVQNRQSDNGFYVDPSQHLDVFPVAGSNPSFTAGTFYDVVLTVDASGTVNSYLNGTPAFSTTTNVMNINNPQNVVNLFLDNVVGGGQGEWSAGEIALARFYSGALTADEVAALDANPFETGGGTTPEPGSFLLLAGAGLGGLLIRKFR